MLFGLRVRGGGMLCMKSLADESAKDLKALGELPSSLTDKRALFRKVRDEIREGLGVESLNGRTLHSSHDKRPSAEFHWASNEFQRELSASKLANISTVQVGSNIIAMVDNKEVQDTVCHVIGNDIYIKKCVTKNCKHPTWSHMKKGTTFKHSGIWFAKMDGTFDELKPISRKLARVDPTWVRELIEKNRPFSLPIFLNPDLFDAIVADKIEDEWKGPTMKLLDSTALLMENASKRFISSMTNIKSLPSLSEYLVSTSSDIVESIKKETAEEISKFINREKTPYTQNQYLFENLAKLRSQSMLDEILSTVNRLADNNNTIPDAGALAADITKIVEQNQKRSIDNHMADEMMNALDSYGKVAFKRFVDTVPMIVVQIMKRFPQMLNDILSDVTDENIEKLVAVPPSALSNMNTLKKEVETLEQGIQTVKGLQRIV